MERVLLLNATYEPLALVSDRRAVVLVLAGRAEAVRFCEDRAGFHWAPRTGGLAPPPVPRDQAWAGAAASAASALSRPPPSITSFPAAAVAPVTGPTWG